MLFWRIHTYHDILPMILQAHIFIYRQEKVLAQKNSKPNRKNINSWSWRINSFNSMSYAEHTEVRAGPLWLRHLCFYGFARISTPSGSSGVNGSTGRRFLFSLEKEFKDEHKGDIVGTALLTQNKLKVHTWDRTGRLKWSCSRYPKILNFYWDLCTWSWGFSWKLGYPSLIPPTHQAGKFLTLHGQTRLLHSLYR
jgi:hypothetical protein